MSPEAKARVQIDTLLTAAGWHVCNLADANIHAARGVAIREFPLSPGFGVADYLLYLAGKAAGVIEAKKEGTTLTGVEVQSARYAQGLPASLPAWVRPLFFSYESTGIETHFTQGLDPQPRALEGDAQSLDFLSRLVCNLIDRTTPTIGAGACG
jgi:type I restriction enzyme, R subunit